MNFIAIDVETANASMASICQIGVAKYENGTFTHEWKSYIDPQDYFDEMNVAVHGIDESTVAGAPTFPDLHNTVCAHLADSVVVCHTHFDRVAMHQVVARYDLTLPECAWLDSARVARRTWSQFSRKGYGLVDVCRMLGYQFQHHDALADAKAAAHILISASAQGWTSMDGSQE